MSDLVGIMLKMKKEEVKDSVTKLACNILRALLVLGGSGWKDELDSSLAALISIEGDTESRSSLRDSETAMTLLKEKGLIEDRKGKRADAAGRSTVEDTLYSLKEYTTVMQVFGTDKLVLQLRGL